MSADHFVLTPLQTPSSNSYNANVRRMCVKLMLETIKSPPFPCESQRQERNVRLLQLGHFTQTNVLLTRVRAS